MTSGIHISGVASTPSIPLLHGFRVFVCILLSVTNPLLAAEVTPGPQLVPLAVYWDFGSGPGKMSNFYVGKRVMSAQYDTPGCASRFTIEGAWYGIVPAAPGSTPVIKLTFAKHFEGDFELLPQVTITVSGRLEATNAAVVFPFRERRKAVLIGADLADLPGFVYTAPKPEWSKADTEIQIEAPGTIMGLLKPYEWSTIEVTCN